MTTHQQQNPGKIGHEHNLELKIITASEQISTLLKTAVKTGINKAQLERMGIISSMISSLKIFNKTIRQKPIIDKSKKWSRNQNVPVNMSVNKDRL